MTSAPRRGRPKLYDSPQQRSRVIAAANRLLKPGTGVLKVRRGEADAKLIVEYLKRRGVKTIAEQRGEVWIVREGEGERET